MGLTAQISQIVQIALVALKGHKGQVTRMGQKVREGLLKGLHRGQKGTSISASALGILEVLIAALGTAVTLPLAAKAEQGSGISTLEPFLAKAESEDLAIFLAWSTTKAIQARGMATGTVAPFRAGAMLGVQRVRDVLG